jgi:hypothetical protein
MLSVFMTLIAYIYPLLAAASAEYGRGMLLPTIRRA